MTNVQESEAKPRKNPGDRIVQILLLLLIAGGLVGIPMVLRSQGSGGAMMGPGGPGGGAPGGPGSSFPGFGGGNANGDATAVRVAVAGIDSVRESIRINGDVEAASSVGICPNTSGKLVSVLVSPGDRVEQGQTIALVDASVPGQVYRPSEVFSTITGTVTAVNSDIGETVNTATEIMIVGDLSSLMVITYVPERYVGSVDLGMTAEVTLDAYPDTVFPARVGEISPVLDVGSRSQKTSLGFLRTDPRIRVGMFASTRIIVREAAGVVTIPLASLTSYYDRDVVFTVENGVATMREVTVGLKSDEIAQIVEGIAEGETVVVQGLSGITDGSPVRIVE